MIKIEMYEQLHHGGLGDILLDRELPLPPRIGDEIEFDDGADYTVHRVVWMMPEIPHADPYLMVIVK